MNIEQDLLRKAITKGLNRSAGKTISEQVNEIFNVIDIFCDIDGIPNAVRPTLQQHEAANLTTRLVTPTPDEVRELSSTEPRFRPTTIDQDWMPSRLGSTLTKESPTDGVNYHKIEGIKAALTSGTPEMIELEVRGKKFKAHRIVNTGLGFGSSEVAQLSYVPEGISWKSAPVARVWTSDQFINVEKTLEEVKQGLYNFLFSITNENRVIANAPPAEQMPTSFDVNDPTSQERSAAGSDKLNTAGMWSGSLATEYVSSGGFGR